MELVELHLDRAYEAASLVRECVECDFGIDEIPWETSVVLECLHKYSKVSLLHYYIYSSISVCERRRFRKDDDWADDDHLADLKRRFDTYGIQITPFEVYIRNNVSSLSASPSDYETKEGHFLPWFWSQEDAFEQYWESVTEEVFHLLFRDRSFLFAFNEMMATHLATDSVAIPADYLAENGRLRRQKYIPPLA